MSEPYDQPSDSPYKDRYDNTKDDKNALNVGNCYCQLEDYENLFKLIPGELKEKKRANFNKAS